MNDKRADFIEKELGLTVVESHERGLSYILGRRVMRTQTSIGISGFNGETFLNISQVRALLKELPDLIEMYC